MPYATVSPSSMFTGSRGPTGGGSESWMNEFPAWTFIPGGPYGGQSRSGSQVSAASMPKATTDQLGGGVQGIEALTQMINGINLQGQQAANNARVPNNPALEQQSSENIGQELRGELPTDVVNQIGQHAAEVGVGRGIGGSPASSAAYLRALGLTSLQQQQTGQRDLSAADARNPGAPLYNPSENILTPYQAANLRLEADRTASARGGVNPALFAPPPSGAGRTSLSGPGPAYPTAPLTPYSFASDRPNPPALGTPGAGAIDWESLFGAPASPLIYGNTAGGGGESSGFSYYGDPAGEYDARAEYNVLQGQQTDPDTGEVYYDWGDE